MVNDNNTLGFFTNQDLNKKKLTRNGINILIDIMINLVWQQIIVAKTMA